MAGYEEVKRLLITGANKGIGLASVELALKTDPNVHVYLGSRSKKRGDQAVQSLLEKDESFKGRVECVQIDVTNDESVAQCAEFLKNVNGGNPCLHGLLNNAGVGTGDLAFQMDVNFYGVDRVVSKLGRFVVPEGRICIVTSAAGPIFVEPLVDMKQKKFFVSSEDPQVFVGRVNEWMKLPEAELKIFFGSSATSGFSVEAFQYTFSKACANKLMLCYASQNKWASVNACTPGYILTDLLTDLVKGNPSGAKPPSEGAKVTIGMMLGDLPENSNGWYFGSDLKRSPLHKYRGSGGDLYDGEFEKEIAGEKTSEN